MDETEREQCYASLLENDQYESCPIMEVSESDTDSIHPTSIVSTQSRPLM